VAANEWEVLKEWDELNAAAEITPPGRGPGCPVPARLSGRPGWPDHRRHRAGARHPPHYQGRRSPGQPVAPNDLV